MIFCVRMMRHVFRVWAILIIAICPMPIKAQGKQLQNDTSIVVVNSFWGNWYAQFGFDMHLQFPEGHKMSDVFPNGKSFGIDAAVGKWFSPEFGGRFKVKWNNGILKNEHNTWLKPYGDPGGNQRRGGFMTFTWDMQFNLHNIIGTYRPDKKWNIIFSPRAGGWLDIYSGKGCPILGVGVENTYRLTDRWRLYADVGYNFVASINEVRSGTGHGSNGYAEINIGVEMDLSSEDKFHKSSEKTQWQKKTVSLNDFWDNWFMQLGLGVSLQNVYGANFSNVFPNGQTFGINAAIGKWFTPETGVRAGLNWQNGIIKNSRASYLRPNVNSEGNPDKSSFVFVYADMLFNLNSLISGYDASRKWNTIAYPRMGIARNFQSEYKECPILGIGLEQTYKWRDRITLYADLAYQVTTSGFHDRKFATPHHGLSSNGWFDINVGIQYEFGKNWWEKAGDKRRQSKWEGGHNWPRFAVNTIGSVGVAFVGKTALKAMIKEDRPDHSDNKSFPSGHAAMAFAAARSIDKEFRKDCIWIPIAGYAAATAVGIQRVAKDRHHWYDVAAGAGVGFGAAELTWWLSDLCFGKGSNIAVGSSGNTVDVTYNF